MDGSTLHGRYGATRRGGKNFEKPRHQCTQILKTIAACYEYHDRYVERGKVLLVRQIAISSEEDLEVADCHGKQFAVALAGPVHLRRCPGLVADELTFQALGEALVKQDAHGRGAPPWPAPRPLRPAPW